jgi:hypothetical protein
VAILFLFVLTMLAFDHYLTGPMDRVPWRALPGVAAPR